MISQKLTLKEMWSRQRINSLDVDYNYWEHRRETIRQMSHMSRSCLFTVDVFKGIYDFASGSFTDIFGFNPSYINNIQQQGDLLEERIHPDDRDKMLDIQIKHGRFIYSLPSEERNNYRNTYQFRMLNIRGLYVNVVSRQQVIQTDQNGKAWIIMGMMDISPDQSPYEDIRYSSCNLKTGEIVTAPVLSTIEGTLSEREQEILQMISQGLLSKEIADKLSISIHTVNNHRKNILLKLKVNNSIEAINYAKRIGLLN